jgi:hypothetical protein
MSFSAVVDKVLFRGYEAAKKKASQRIVARQSRGNISTQNGWYMSAEKLYRASRAADKDIEHLRKLTRAAS